MLLIADVQPSGIEVKGIRVLHHELTQAQQARFWPWLVAELRLDLVPDLRQLLVAAQLPARDLRYDFLMGHAEAQVTSPAVLETKHAVAHDLPAATGLPQFLGV